MAERRENSVLISLRELRQIEDDRVVQEKDDARRRDEEQQRAREAAERAQRDEAERVRREAEEAERRKIEDEQRRLREEQLRLEEAERRARVDAQMKLEAERLRMEMEVKKATGPKIGAKIIVPVAAGLLLLIGGLGIVLYKQNQEKKQLAAENAAIQQSIDDSMARIKKNNAETQDLIAKLADEHDEAKRAALQEELRQKEAERKAEEDRIAGLRAKKSGGGGKKVDKDKGDKGIKTVKCDPNDPLCGI